MPAESITVYAKWTANTNTAYKVKHLQQNTSGSGYALLETEGKEGTTGALTAAIAKTYAGFTVQTFTQKTIAADGTELQGGIAIGSFFAQIINFFVLALVLFGMVKVLKKAKLGNFRAQGSRECDFCKEFIPVDAIKCKHCTADIEPIIPD